MADCWNYAVKFPPKSPKMNRNPAWHDEKDTCWDIPPIIAKKTLWHSCITHCTNNTIIQQIDLKGAPLYKRRHHPGLQALNGRYPFDRRAACSPITPQSGTTPYYTWAAIKDFGNKMDFTIVATLVRDYSLHKVLPACNQKPLSS